MRSIDLSIVCPMANEQEYAEKFVREVLENCRAFNFKSINFFLILDKTSLDNTIPILRDLEKTEPEIDIVFLPDNETVAGAYICGYQKAIKSKSDWILEIDAGYSHLPSNIPSFFEKMKQGYDCVFGSRFCLNGKYEGRSSRYFLSYGGSIITNFLFGTNLSDMTSGYQLFTHKALKRILEYGIASRGPFFQTEIKIHAHKFNITEIPIYYNATSKMNLYALYDALFHLCRLFIIKTNLKKRSKL